MQSITEIERLRKNMLVGKKHGNRFLEGFSKSAVLFHPVDLEGVWVRLIDNGQRIQIQSGVSATSSLENPPSATEPENIERSEVIKQIYTASTLSSLKRLLRKANEGLEERGFNFLNLCIGKIHWNDDQHAGTAPALLIPIRFVQTAVRLGISIEFADEAIQWNPAIVEKLRSQLPPDSIPDSLFGDLSGDSFEQIQAGWACLQSCVEQAQWHLESAFALNLLETSQIQLYRDLDPSDWQTVPKLIQQVLGTGFVVDTQLQSIHAATISQRLQAPEGLPLILDADPTQMQAVAVALAGGNLVIQGPPGTGKSQTIANIMSTMIAQGKRVLFVAQKKAALDVVYQRLCDANLEHLILELHSIKSKRSAVLKSLSKARNQKGIQRQLPDDIPQKTAQHRQQLEQINAVLQSPIGQSECRLCDIFSHAHQSPPVIDAPIMSFKKVLDWDLDRVALLKQTSVELGRLLQTESLSWAENPFQGVQTTNANLLEDDQLFDLVERLHLQMGDLALVLQKQQQQVGCHFDGTFGGIDQLLTELQFLASRPSIAELNRTLLQYDYRFEEAITLLSQGQALGDIERRLEGIFKPTSLIQYKRIESVFGILQDLKPRWWKIFLPKWWTANTEFRTFFTQTLTPEQAQGPLEELESFHLQLVDFEKESTMGGLFFGALWKGLRSDWNDLHQRLQWLKQYSKWSERHPYMVDTNVVDSLDGLQQIVSIHQQIDETYQKVQRTFDDLQRRLQPLETSPIFFSPYLPIEAVLQWLKHPNLNREALGRAIAINQVCLPLRDADLEVWIQWIMGGQSIPSVSQHWEFLIGHSRIQRVIGFPNIQRLTRSTLERLRNNYIEQDERLPLYTQEQLVAAHTADVQSLLSVGQLAVLTLEMSKSRSRRSIRWLMSNCREAIQRLKPMMMMSPLSVATHLPTDMQFDVVIFDEASQMTTPFALGALMRANQAIVVGDSQQLSPTSFFQQAKDMESILDRFVANGCPSIRLSFHYRSRHPSLISISNRFMYDGGLKPFPTPNTHSLARGVRILSSVGCPYDRGGTRTNIQEAELVVKSVARRMVEAIQEGNTLSIGMVAFSLGQKEVLQDAWDKLLSHRSDLRQYTESLPDGEKVFIKNLEDVQGDERDVIFISVGYGLDANGGFTLNFGPVGREGGERRLNVLFSRARYEMVIAANFKPHRLTSENKAFQMLKSMLELSTEEPAVDSRSGAGFVEDISMFIESIGYKALPNYGPEGNTIDIAVQDRETGQCRLAILCEGGTETQLNTTRYRERLFPQSLEAFGWPVYRVWSLPWYSNPKAEQQALQKAIEEATPSRKQAQLYVVRRQVHSVTPTFDWVKTVELDRANLEIAIPADAQPKTHPHLIQMLMKPLLIQEGPLSTSMVLTRMCQLLPAKRTSRNREAVESVLRQLSANCLIQTQYGFYWHQDSDMKPRIPVDQFRDFSDLYPPHVLSFVRYYLNGTVEKRLSITEMAELLMNLVGWSAISQEGLEKYSKGIIQVVTDTEIDLVDGRLVLSGVSD